MRGSNGFRRPVILDIKVHAEYPTRFSKTYALESKRCGKRTTETSRGHPGKASQNSRASCSFMLLAMSFSDALPLTRNRACETMNEDPKLTCTYMSRANQGKYHNQVANLQILASDPHFRSNPRIVLIPLLINRAVK